MSSSFIEKNWSIFNGWSQFNSVENVIHQIKFYLLITIDF